MFERWWGGRLRAEEAHVPVVTLSANFTISSGRRWGWRCPGYEFSL